MLVGFGQEGVNYKAGQGWQHFDRGHRPQACMDRERNAADDAIAEHGLCQQAHRAKGALSFVQDDQRSIQDRWRTGADSTNRCIRSRPARASSTRHRMPLTLFDLMGRTSSSSCSVKKPLTDQAWADYLAGLDKLGAKELEASAKQTLTQTGFLK